MIWRVSKSVIQNFQNICYVFIFGFASTPEFFVDEEGRCRHILYEIVITNNILPYENDLGFVKDVSIKTTENNFELTLFTEVIKK